MSKLRRTWIVMMVAIGLLASASVASADDTVVEEKAPAGDTLFSYGYDAVNHIFIVHTSTTDSTYDCSVPTHVMVGYGSVADGSFSVSFLDNEGVAVEFPERTTDEVLHRPVESATESCRSLFESGPRLQKKGSVKPTLFR